MDKHKNIKEKEYESLRQELLQGRRYVFERPLLIVTGSIALIQFADKESAIYFPLIMILLLHFNLWFTINRIRSMSKIIAYIQLVLENEESKWFGWETSLRSYRKLLKSCGIKADKIKVKNKAVYENLGYYQPIYLMHVIVTISVFLLLAIFTIFYFENEYIILSLLTFGVLISFIVYAIKWNPNYIKPEIERNRKIWKIVFIEWETLADENIINIIKLSDSFIKILVELPENRMDYQVVKVTLKNGEILRQHKVINSSLLMLEENENITEKDIEKIELESRR